MIKRDQQELTQQAKKSLSRDLKEAAAELDEKPDLTISGVHN